jgi:class 3 adenylate cyclase
MVKNTLKAILQDRSVRNERAVAIARLTIVLSMTILDWLNYLRIVNTTYLPPSWVTIALDSCFLAYAFITLLFAIRGRYYPALKYIVVGLDYLLIYAMINFDPTLDRGSSIMPWMAMTSAIWVFFLNGLRNSFGGMVYGGILSVVFFIAVSFLSQMPFIDFMPNLIALFVFLFIGIAITSGNLRMMKEATTKTMMERYLPPQLVGELYKQNPNLEPGGKKQEVSILFSDIEDFTALSESLEPEKIVHLLNAYLSCMTEVIYRNGGTIDKFMGDAIMTLFGAPVQGDDDPVRAVRTAIQMQQALEEFNRQGLGPVLRIGVGIHSGEVIVGNIGSERRLDYTVIGDNVNLAARIEGLTRLYRVPVLISEKTKALLPPSREWVLRAIDRVIVKGKTTSLDIYEVWPIDGTNTYDELASRRDAFEKALALYREKQFSEAAAGFKSLGDDHIALLYWKRCAHLIKNPPKDDWEGVFVLKSK